MRRIIKIVNGKRIVLNIPSYEEEEAALINQLRMGEAGFLDSAGSGSLPTPPVYPPSFILQPVGATLEEGGTLTLSALAAPPLDFIAYQWYFAGSPLVNDFRISGATTSTLTISSLNLADNGTYWCQAQNTYGYATSSNISVNIIGGGGNLWNNNPFLWNQESQVWKGDKALWNNTPQSWEGESENWETISTT